MSLLSEKYEPKDDLLKRGPFADVMVDFIKATDSAVFALNSPWGGGKSFFIDKVLNGKLTTAGVIHKIKLDAFEYDYHTEPFMSIAISLVKYFQEFNNFKLLNKEKEVKRFIECSWALINGFGKEVLKNAPEILSKAAGLATLATTLNPVAAKGVEITTKQSCQGIKTGFQEAKAEKRKTIVSELNDWLAVNDQQTFLLDEIKKSLQGIIDKMITVDGKEKHPLIFIIDELDRCRPSYAVELLEKIKHIFSVEGIIFILAVNPDQLESSIKHVYGQDVNAKEYLHKFYDLQFTLPDPVCSESCDIKMYVEHYMDAIGIVDPFYADMEKDYSYYAKLKDSYLIRVSHIENKVSENKYITELCISLAKCTNLTLRDIQKVFIVLLSLQRKKLDLSVATTLVFMKIRDPELFNQFLLKEYNESLLLKPIENPLLQKYLDSSELITRYMSNYTKLKKPGTDQIDPQINEAFEKLSAPDRYRLLVCLKPGSIKENFEKCAEAIEYVFEAIDEK
jgi:hypothetical protein